MKVRTSHSNISVVVNAAEIIALKCWLDVYYDLIKIGYTEHGYRTWIKVFIRNCK